VRMIGLLARPPAAGRSAVALLVVALAAPGCGDRQAPPPGDGVPVRTAEPDLRIGQVDGSGLAVFGAIGGLAVDDDGRIFVADLQADEVRVFGADGRHEQTIGRSGAGPGELSQPCCAAFAPDGRLWVRDNGNARYNAYRMAGDRFEPAGSVRMRHGARGFMVATTFDEAGRLIDIGGRTGAGRWETVRFHLDDDGSPVREVVVPDAPEGSIAVHTVQRALPAGMATLYLSQPFGPRHLVAHGRDGSFAEAISSSYLVRWYGPDGSLSHTIERAGEPGPPLGPGEIERGREALEGEARRAGRPVGELPFRLPERKQPLDRLLFDEAGRLWVQLSVPEGENRRAHVYDADGRHVETIEWPAGLDLSTGVVRPDVLIGVERDSLDVPYVVRLPIS
jgi:sugar lactone lactonase YvrE